VTNPLTKFFIKAWSESAVSAAHKLTSQVRRQAYQMGWPTEVSRHLLVDVQNGEYVVTYPKQVKESVLDLEFGNQTRPPLPLIRHFLTNLDDTGMRKEVEKHLKKTGLHF
jgi:hypothetical protein